MEQSLKGGEQQHEERDAVLLADFFQVCDKVRRQREEFMRSAKCLHGRARAVRGQFEQLWCAREFFPPILGMFP